MNVICPKCRKVIQLPLEKLPQDKEKAMIKCPGCQQAIVFNVQKMAGLSAVSKKEEGTIIDNILTSNQKETFNPQLIDILAKREYKLSVGKNIIGRKSDISIDNGDKYISRKHCIIEIIERRGNFEIILTDDGSISDNNEPSTNGTFYNGKRLTKYDKIYLHNGDELKIGLSDFAIKTQ